MFISKNLLDNPTQRPAFTDIEIYKRAAAHYAHFEKNKLWYVDADRSCSHVFFDGEYNVEVNQKYVHFSKEGKDSDYQVIDVFGTLMVRHKRSIKPILYHPTLMKTLDSQTVYPMTPAEIILFTAHPELVQYCIYNRCRGWTIDLCDATYPLDPGISISFHTRRIYDWFKATHQLINLESKTYRKRVCSVRFSVA